MEDYERWADVLARRSEKLYLALRESALRSTVAINASAYRHTVLTTAFRKAVYDRSLVGKSVQLAFMDSSRPEPFPVGQLEELKAQPSSATELTLGLMTFRHPELDFLVDLYLMRNRELAEEPIMADEEALTYRRTVELLSDEQFEAGGVIDVLHTGLEPMVLGFYRGVVSVLSTRIRKGVGRNLVIRPRVYIGSRQEGIYSRQSPGAQLSNYATLAAWY